MKRIVVAVLVGLLAIAGVPAPGRWVAPALACEEEGGGLVSVRVNATLAPADAANIVFELFNGTLTIKGIKLTGSATWYDNETELFTGPVNVIGVILTTGDQTTYLQNRGIVWLKYQFIDPNTAAVIGTADGFVTLEQVGDAEGQASFQGDVLLAGVQKQFAGTGWSRVRGLNPAPPAPAPVAGAVGCWTEGGSVGCWDQTPGISQEMDQTVITGQKPGFAFETAGTIAALTRQYNAQSTLLLRQRNQRLGVIRRLR
jgi:hypothetical protein